MTSPKPQLPPTTSEQLVRSVWINPLVICNAGGAFYVWLPCEYFTPIFDTKAEAWHAAAEFTRNRQEQVRQVEEEIALQRSFEPAVSLSRATLDRTLRRLEAIRADLTPGMKEMK